MSLKQKILVLICTVMCTYFIYEVYVIFFYNKLRPETNTERLSNKVTPTMMTMATVRKTLYEDDKEDEKPLGPPGGVTKLGRRAGIWDLRPARPGLAIRHPGSVTLHVE